ncbi:hypothetical protein RhiirA5_378376 [Rhizophagus irregularis]|uniref:BED-type domain-containing protein n=1 Tax=Rhizophagus irregularis TaxID=588596 RepID=A0A2N0PFY5_9GLOM|nr:hypothetical protein RhiirA5_378376 [Rhizophagus irregularis]
MFIFSCSFAVSSRTDRKVLSERRFGLLRMQEPSAEGIVSLERRVRWTSKNTRDTGRNGFFFLFFQNDNFSGSLRMQDGREEFSQEPFQESPQEESPQEPFQEFPEPFQEPPQGLTKNPPQKSLPKKKIILKKQKHIQYFNTWDPQYPTKVVCKKCNHTYSKSTGINTLKEHLKKVHGIVIDKIKKNRD